MNRFCLLAIGFMLAVALTAPAEQTATAASGADKQVSGQPGDQSVATSVDQHLQLLSERLDLTADQQAKMRPILEQMLDARQKVVQDNSLSAEVRDEKMKALHENADKQARKFLNDDQKKKLDELEQQPHP